MSQKQEQRMLSPKQAAGMVVPPVSDDTARRWMSRGIVLNGVTIRLKATRLGSRWMTTEEAITQFIQECQETIK